MSNTILEKGTCHGYHPLKRVKGFPYPSPNAPKKAPLKDRTLVSRAKDPTPYLPGTTVNSAPDLKRLSEGSKLFPSIHNMDISLELDPTTVGEVSIENDTDFWRDLPSVEKLFGTGNFDWVEDLMASDLPSLEYDWPREDDAGATATLTEISSSPNTLLDFNSFPGVEGLLGDFRDFATGEQCFNEPSYQYTGSFSSEINMPAQELKEDRVPGLGSFVPYSSKEVIFGMGTISVPESELLPPQGHSPYESGSDDASSPRDHPPLRPRSVDYSHRSYQKGLSLNNLHSATTTTANVETGPRTAIPESNGIPGTSSQGGDVLNSLLISGRALEVTRTAAIKLLASDDEISDGSEKGVEGTAGLLNMGISTGLKAGENGKVSDPVFGYVGLSRSDSRRSFEEPPRGNRPNRTSHARSRCVSYGLTPPYRSQPYPVSQFSLASTQPSMPNGAVAQYAPSSASAYHLELEYRNVVEPAGQHNLDSEEIFAPTGRARPSHPQQLSIEPKSTRHRGLPPPTDQQFPQLRGVAHAVKNVARRVAKNAARPTADQNASKSNIQIDKAVVHARLANRNKLGALIEKPVGAMKALW
jgi:hypothetical protein